MSNTNINKWQVVMLVSLVLFSPLAIDIYLPALPMIADVFHVKHAMVQDTITWFLFSMGIGQIFAGPLADKYGRKSVAITGIAIYGLSSLLAWWSINIEWLLLARLLQGLGACATSVAAFATVRDMFGPEKSGKMISYLNGAICFIPALAPILGSYLTQQLGWRSNFSFMALYAAVIGTVLLISMKETNPKQEPGNSYFKLNRYLAVLRNPTFTFHASLCMLAMAVILAYVTAAPIVLMKQLGLTMNEFTYWFGANAVFNIISAFSAPKLMDKLGTKRALIVGISMMLLASGLMLILPSNEYAWAFMLPIFISSTSFALILGAAAGKALAPFGDKAGTAAALLGLFQMSGAGLLVGTLQRFDLTLQMTISLQMMLIAPALIILVSKLGKQWHESYTG
ncbi:Bcr/CflA family drug resistance efflux transporter [Vibrio sp. MACH09]|nr:multidrug effflux MFS transporter [Vibrio sp. MACH09]GLO62331.1 Bcr/CflA family drug resistance efflux transporter [Vibrio sp. MACH09]